MGFNANVRASFEFPKFVAWEFRWVPRTCPTFTNVQWDFYRFREHSGDFLGLPLILFEKNVPWAKRLKTRPEMLVPEKATKCLTSFHPRR